MSNDIQNSLEAAAYNARAAKRFRGTDIPDSIMLEAGRFLTSDAAAKLTTVHQAVAAAIMAERKRYNPVGRQWRMRVLSKAFGWGEWSEWREGSAPSPVNSTDGAEYEEREIFAK